MIVSDLTFREATVADVPGIAAMLADDSLGAAREDLSDLSPYYAAFDQITADPMQHLIVAELASELVGTMQLTLIPGLSRRGATSALIESVRVASGARGSGAGTAPVKGERGGGRGGIEFARSSGASMVQLTSDLSRTDAHRFYERLGFSYTHAGFKLALA
jgi:GNAT superfamily N-acetyltransferase